MLIFTAITGCSTITFAHNNPLKESNTTTSKSEYKDVRNSKTHPMASSAAKIPTGDNDKQLRMRSIPNLNSDLE